MSAPFNLKDHGVTVAEIHRNLPSALYSEAASPKVRCS
jgi:hypothetical protein